MTTIAYDGRILAYDNSSICYYLNMTETVKYMSIYKPKESNRTHIAMAGDLSKFSALCNWISQGATPSKAPFGGWTLLVIYEKIVHYYARENDETDPVYPIKCNTPVAIGSGLKFAIGAMKAGATAIKAVEIARECDEYTNGQVKHINV